MASGMNLAWTGVGGSQEGTAREIEIAGAITRLSQLGTKVNRRRK